MAEVESSNGIAITFDSWMKNGKYENLRSSFYQSVLSAEIEKLESKLNLSLDAVPIIVSGMASSSIGMAELPYKEIPFCIDGYDLYTELLEANTGFNHTSLIISGAKTNDDAIRGEETQLIGCVNGNNRNEHFFIFPGTHSKHITVRNGKAVDIKTYMTGEFFELLSKKSILSYDIEPGEDIISVENKKAFEKGVWDSQQLNLLHSAFLIRTNRLFNNLSKHENYYYLSGLVIGAELKEIVNLKLPVTIVSNEWLIRYYSAALTKLGLYGIKYLQGSKAVINGHFTFFKRHESALIRKTIITP